VIAAVLVRSDKTVEIEGMGPPLQLGIVDVATIGLDNVYLSVYNGGGIRWRHCI
jgi:hypothetical protein